MWVGVLSLMLTWGAGGFLLSVLKAPGWAIPALLGGVLMVWLITMTFVPIKGDDGQRHPAFTLGSDAQDDGDA
jgi:hypothetical protein